MQEDEDVASCLHAEASCGFTACSCDDPRTDPVLSLV